MPKIALGLQAVVALIAAALFAEGEITVNLGTVATVLAFMVMGMGVFSLYRENIAMRSELKGFRTNAHKMRNNYMTVLLGFSMVVQIVLELNLDRATKNRMEETKKEVERQLAELREEAKRKGAEPPWARPED